MANTGISYSLIELGFIDNTEEIIQFLMLMWLKSDMQSFDALEKAGVKSSA